ncbi:asparaginase [Pseudomonas sp. LS1212]|uniref:asparaginase n=1 Tax=Pseudomonas sp. LS1212 TaxID=2972478 RepID=UPI00215CD332|nr:asparaginase [Pseudomonas sp. LS1212]UVJ42961.1 asparaginase [Pseudomonas sp. LS1212]
MTQPKLSIGALGGTVSMQAKSAGEGVTPALTGEAMLASLPELAELALINVETLCLLPSASLDFEQLLTVLRWAKAQVEQGATGVVLTQGTDTLEESAYFLDLLWDLEVPLVMTGAMRSASQIGADGPANLMAAIKVALDKNSRQRGVQVVMNDQVHAAAWVRKSDALALDAFTSPLFGPVGVMVEGRVRYLGGAPAERVTLPYPGKTHHRVALLEAVLGADTRLLEQIVSLGYEGLVIAGFGVGHVDAEWAERIGRIAEELPVVIASRTGSGTTTQHSYGFVGGEMDLQGRGAVMAGFLCPRKSRVLLWLLIGGELQGEVGVYFSGE